jgi:ABC-type glycerol-3-phosphate transport system permease component
VWAFILVWGDYLTQDLFFLLDKNGTLLTRVSDRVVHGGAGAGLPLALYAVPPVVFFVLVQRHIMQTVVTSTGIKG